MDLKFRRNLPLLLLFVTIVAILVLGLGDQPIIAYTFEKNEEQSDGMAVTAGDLMGDLLSLPASENAGVVAPESDTAESLESDSVSQDHEIAVSSEGAIGSIYQPDEG